MKSKSKRNKQLMLVLMSSLLTLTACSSGNAVEPPVESSPNRAEATPDFSSYPSYYSENPVTIRMFTETAQSWPYKADWPIWRWIEEETNITVKGEIPTGNYADTPALNIASGDIQDVMYLPSNLANKYGSEGVLLDLSLHLDDMPNLKAFFNEHPDIKARATAPDGEIYHSIFHGSGVTNWMIWFAREDILEQHQLVVPQTWDELYEVSKQLKELYPDSYPFIFRHGLNNLRNFAPTFLTHTGFFPDPDTRQVRYGPTENEFKEMIAYLNKFYEEGLIPPDWLSMDVKVWNQAMTTGKSFITVQYIAQLEIINNQLKDGRLTFMPPPAGPNGKPYIPNTAYKDGGYSVFSQTNNLEAALKFIDFMYSDRGEEIASWGKENETYTIENGERTFLPEFKEFSDLRKNVGFMTEGSYGKFDTEAMIRLIREDERYSYDEAPKYAFPVQVVTPNFKPEEMEQYQLLSTRITKHYEENMAKFIMGSRPLSEWERYVQEAEALGVEELAQMYQLGWDRQEAN